MKNSEKKDIRAVICKKRRQLTPTQLKTLSSQITQKLLSLTVFKNSEHIAAYMPDQGEVDTLAIIKEIQLQKKKCYLPVISADKELLFSAYTENDALQKNTYSILEPAHTGNSFPPNCLSLALVPLVAFDSQGHRLGRGAGYYDRSFAFKLAKPPPHSPVLIGLAYEFQKVADFDLEPWDIPLNCVVTENNIYKHKI